jgi:hypothetical protein
LDLSETKRRKSRAVGEPDGTLDVQIILERYHHREFAPR